MRACVRACVCVYVYALRTVSVDKILRFMDTLMMMMMMMMITVRVQAETDPSLHGQFHKLGAERLSTMHAGHRWLTR